MNPISIQTSSQPLTYSHLGKPGPVKPESASFGELLKKSIQQVNQLQNESNAAVEKLATGQEKDVHNTMIAMEKASVSFHLTMQVRNKMIEAYQEVMRMQV